MEKTIKLKLDLLEKDKETLRQTMTMSNKVLNEIAAYGFEHHICSKVSVHKATYYNKRVCNINLHNNSVTLASIKGRVKGAFPIPEYYKQYLSWELRTSTLSYNKQKNVFYLHVTIHKQSPEPSGDRVAVEDLTGIRMNKGNRKGHSFRCLKCGFQIHADLNAARNIAFIGKTDIGRLTVTQPYIACNDTGVGILVEHSDNGPVFIDRG